jgi:phosphatidylserine/phosphatidylglycerophosphate/cardiolipin synthase-like enzyme
LRNSLKFLCLLWLLLCSLPWSHATEAKSIPETFIADGTVQVAFSPWDDTQALLIDAIAAAKTQIFVQAYLLTSRTIASGLINARQRGVDVRVMADSRQHEDTAGSLLDLLQQNNIPVWLETRYRHAHNKVLLIDVAGMHPIVITGSYNFTWGAQNMNAENLLIFRDNRRLTERYAKNWERHWRQARPYTVSEKK